MSTNQMPLPDNFLASPAQIASLLDHFSEPPSRRRGRQSQDLPDWLNEMLTATAPLTDNRFNPPKGRSIVATTPALAAQQVEGLSRPEPKVSAKIQAHTAHLRRRGRCQCGQCPSCLDNARWERVFNEKFNDPSYYGSLSVRHSSTLAGA